MMREHLTEHSILTSGIWILDHLELLVAIAIAIAIPIALLYQRLGFTRIETHRRFARPLSFTAHPSAKQPRRIWWLRKL